MLSKLVTPPTVDPVTLQEAKDFLRVEHSHEDSAITRFLRAACFACQKVGRISFLDQVWEATYTLPKRESMPANPYPYAGQLGGAAGYGGSLAFGLLGPFSSVPGTIDDPDDINSGLTLPYGPVTSITALSLTSDTLSDFAVDSSNYTLTNAQIVWKESFRALLLNQSYSGVKVRYHAGFANKSAMDTFAPDLQTAVLMTVAMIYEHRGLSEVSVPPAALRLLNNYWDSPTY